ncbi:MAG: hypothetical protein PVG41_21990 [Desulfobacteraceae bacterium]|jgi:hypothetical protein
MAAAGAATIDLLFRQANGAAMYLAKGYKKFIHQYPEVFEK